MDRIKSFRDVKIRPALIQLLNLGILISSALVLWKGLMCITACESPVVVVLTGSMEPGFRRGDILFLHMNKEPIRAGEIVVYNIDVHERKDTGEIDILTKGDNNPVDDVSLYSGGQLWLNRHHIIGRAKGYLPYVGYLTIIMTETPMIKYALIGVMALLVITTKE
ncbi:uncharacterized protein LOC144575556 isoform X2 [Carex rostrata]